jgi:hypothetical protein
MSRNTQSSVGQNPGRVLYAPSAPFGSNCKMQSAKCKVQNAERPSQPPAPSPQPLGISLVEVLIAMGILTVGLLGVAAIFPVASFYMQKGDVADRGSAIAQAAFNDALARGVFDPANWYAMTRDNLAEPPATYGLPSDGPNRTFSRPVLKSIADAKALWPTAAFCQRVGHAYAIDPIGAAAISNETLPNANNQGARPFPASASILNLRSDYYNSAWTEWLGTNGKALWPIRRVTLRQPRVGSIPAIAAPFNVSDSLSPTTAEALFSSRDDLSLDVPLQSNRPSTQLLTTIDLNGDGKPDPLARASRGDYSWLATVVPSDPWLLADTTCEVSVVVFYKRVLGTHDDIVTSAAAERMVEASIRSTGLSGGEVLLTPSNDGITETPFNGLKVGQWMMLCGPSPDTSDARPKFVARWYRVLSIEQQDQNRLVSLRGPQWPWQPQSGGGALSNNLCAGIFPGAVAVHSKAISLHNNSSWSVQ